MSQDSRPSSGEETALAALIVGADPGFNARLRYALERCHFIVQEVLTVSEASRLLACPPTRMDLAAIDTQALELGGDRTFRTLQTHCPWLGGLVFEDRPRPPFPGPKGEGRLPVHLARTFRTRDLKRALAAVFTP